MIFDVIGCVGHFIQLLYIVQSIDVTLPLLLHIKTWLVIPNVESIQGGAKDKEKNDDIRQYI